MPITEFINGFDFLRIYLLSLCRRTVKAQEEKQCESEFENGLHIVELNSMTIQLQYRTIFNDYLQQNHIVNNGTTELLGQKYQNFILRHIELVA